MKLRQRSLWVVMASMAIATGWVLLVRPGPLPGGDSAIRRVIVQGESTTSVAGLVRAAGGKVTHELGIIDAVAAELDAGQLEELARADGVRRIYDDRKVETRGQGGGGKQPTGESTDGKDPYTHFPTLVGADLLHAEGITGYGVTLAVLDTGHDNFNEVDKNSEGRWRFLAHYDAIQDKVLTSWYSDDNGHGMHVTSISLSSARQNTRGGKYNGIAPGADLVAVKALDANGQGTYADVIRGIDWIVANKDAYGIRVLNLSIGGPVLSHYWDDPLNQAVMRAWQAGIVVVASAGNAGSDPMTISVPGNVPYVVTVGAMTDSYTPADGTDDRLASFSAAGPTYEAFLKPEVVAPGGHMLGIVNGGDTLAVE